jgi:hypothetical protein
MPFFPILFEKVLVPRTYAYDINSSLNLINRRGNVMARNQKENETYKYKHADYIIVDNRI